MDLTPSARRALFLEWRHLVSGQLFAAF